MPDVIVNTSPLQYLFQLSLLELLPSLYGQVIVPEAVVLELDGGSGTGLFAASCRETCLDNDQASLNIQCCCRWRVGWGQVSQRCWPWPEKYPER